ncbi:hypothetical protein QWT36_23785, partial [Salmonella enterica subsp. enterica serovar Typhi]|nr:hypothetical protein [Salmonella enterica subsp. enterica serovar Typhi]
VFLATGWERVKALCSVACWPRNPHYPVVCDWRHEIVWVLGLLLGFLGDWLGTRKSTMFCSLLASQSSLSGRLRLAA